jgi:hypothetical protein
MALSCDFRPLIGGKKSRKDSRPGILGASPARRAADRLDLAGRVSWTASAAGDLPGGGSGSGEITSLAGTGLGTDRGSRHGHRRWFGR